MLKSLDNTLFSKTLFFITLSVFVAFSLFGIKFSTIYFILISGAVGLLFYGIKSIKKDVISSCVIGKKGIIATIIIKNGIKETNK